MWRVWALNPTNNPSSTLHAPSQKSVPFYGALLSCGNYSGRLLLARDTIQRAQTASFHAYLAPSQTGYFGHQTTCVVAIPRMCKTRLLTFLKCFEMLTRFGFRGKMYYLCTSEEERALKTGLSPFFFAQYKGWNTKHLGISRCFIGNFLGFIGNFLGFIGERIADVGFFSRPKL